MKIVTEGILEAIGDFLTDRSGIAIEYQGSHHFYQCEDRPELIDAGKHLFQKVRITIETIE